MHWKPQKRKVERNESKFTRQIVTEHMERNPTQLTFMRGSLVTYSMNFISRKNQNLNEFKRIFYLKFIVKIKSQSSFILKISFKLPKNNLA